MKILFINQFFWPDSSATSQQLTDLAVALVDRGAEVTVLCGGGGYAEAAGEQAPPVTILRVKATRFAKNKLGRMLSYLSFYATAFGRGLTAPKADIVVSMTTPPLISLLGSAIKLVRGSRHFIWEQDIYPDIAVDLRYLKPGGLAHRVTGWLADLSRRHADGVIVLGECMKQRLMRRGIPEHKISVAEHWASSTAIVPRPRPGDPEELVLLYSGNFGLAHDLDTVAGAILNLREDSCFRFLFVGTGDKRKALAAFCESHSIHSVEMRPFVPRDQLCEGLAAGDIGLVTQEDSSCGSIVPSKVYGILASGRPILFIGPADATPALLIARHGCGWRLACGDVEGVTRVLRELAANRQLVTEAARRAREALVTHYDLPRSVARIANILGAPPATHPQPADYSREASQLNA